MRTLQKWMAALALIAASAATAEAQKQRYSESHRPDPLLYPLTMKVIGSHVTRTLGPSNVVNGQTTGEAPTVSTLHVIAVIDGEKIELEAGASAMLHKGDYPARVIANDEKKSGWFSRSYELLFSDGTHVVFTMVGESD